MLTSNETVTLPYTKDQLCDLVADVEKYPEFLPWCNKCKVIKKNSPTHFFAELEVSYKNFKKSYVSEVIITKGELENTIDVVMVKGPFKKLVNNWKFVNLEGQSELSFFIKLELKSMVMQALLKSLFSNAYKKMVKAFIDRADEVFATNS